jgi:hypothetical protein
MKNRRAWAVGATPAKSQEKNADYRITFSRIEFKIQARIASGVKIRIIPRLCAIIQDIILNTSLYTSIIQWAFGFVNTKFKKINPRVLRD